MIHAASHAVSSPEDPKSIETLIQSIHDGLRHQPCSLALVFASGLADTQVREVARIIHRDLAPQTLIGCNAESIIGPEHEYEQQPAIVVWGAHLPGTGIRPFRMTRDTLEQANSTEALCQSLQIHNPAGDTTLVLGDPFSFNINQVLQRINSMDTPASILGGMASGGVTPGGNVLLYDEACHSEGCVGVTLSGGVRIESVISQGCHPIGQPLLVTQAEENVIHTLSGRPPLEQIKAIFHEASEAEQDRMNQGLFIGRVINEYQSEFRRGDFLIRNIMGADNETGALAVMDRIEPGTTVQFHIRDAVASEEDLRAMLSPRADSSNRAALLFSCNGRGTRLYEEPDHDLSIIRQTLGALPLAGFFCAGELGPVGGKNFIHGHTASVLLFQDTEDGSTGHP